MKKFSRDYIIVVVIITIVVVALVSLMKIKIQRMNDGASILGEANGMGQNIKKEGADNIFQDAFSDEKVIKEGSTIEDTDDVNWWLNSGALFFVRNGVGRTLFGKLGDNDYWRKTYAEYNSQETDGGYRPQNLFRLITLKKWENFQQENYFKIQHYESSPTKHRFESNGILLLSRYLDENNLYYAGLRVDGAVVVKKKYKGEYYTMVHDKILDGVYDRDKNPNLIPLNKWIGIRSKVQTIEQERVKITVLFDLKGDGKWVEVASVIDDGVKYGGPAILQAGHAGIRTDFMDVEFDNYSIK